MGRTRTLGRLASLFCVICCAVWLWRQVLHQPVDLRRFVTLYLVGLVFAIGARLQALRWVVPTRGGWMLAPLVGRPWRLPRFREVFVRGEDVIAIAADGCVIMLGVDRFPFRDPVEIRRRLVRDLAP